MPDVVVVPASTANARCSPAELAAARAEASQLRAELQAAKAAARAREAATSLRLEQSAAELARSRAHAAELQRRLELSEQLRARQRTRRRTPTERLLRRAFAAKVEELALTHARTTARMLNVQKRCFEEELESLESEAHATVTAFERHISSLRNDSNLRIATHQREKDAALAKTATVLDAVKRRMDGMERKVTEEQAARKRAEFAAHERHRQLVTVCNRLKIVEGEVTRKNNVIDTLQNQLNNSWAELRHAREIVASTSVSNTADVPGCATAARLLNARTASRSDTDTKRLGAVFASVMADLVSAQSDVSSGDGEDEHHENPAATKVVQVTSSATA